MASAQGIRAGSAYVELFVDNSKLARGLKSASAKLNAFGSAITGLGTRLAAIGTAVTAPLLGFAKVFASGAKGLQSLSQRTGISVEALSELGYAAELAGTDMETLELGVKRMQKTLAAAVAGGEQAAEVLSDLGLSIDDLRGLSPDQQFKLIADRLAQIQSPALRAALAMQLFGRSGTRLLPMISEGAAGIEALQEQARKLGLTATSAGVAVGVKLEESLTTLWKVLKKVGTTLGSAIAPLLTQWANRLIDIIVVGTKWIKQNKELVLRIFKIALTVVAAGTALIILGKAIAFVATVLTGLATIVGVVSAVFGVLWSAIAFLVTPIGLVITAVTALGAYLIYASGAGGKALAWLGERFKTLSEFARKSFQGISDALMAGDIALAAKILWLSLKVLWQKGVLELTRLWEWLRTGALKIVSDLWYGVEAAWEIGVASVAEVMLKLYYGVLDVWNRLSTGVMNIWDSTVNWVAKRITDLWGLIDESIDTEGIKKNLDADLQSRMGERDKEKTQGTAKIGKERDQALKYLQKEHEAKMAKIGQSSIDAESQLDSDGQKKITEAQKELDAAKKEWQEAIAKARKKRQLKEAGGPERLPGPPDIGDLLEGLNQARDRTVGVSGTFNALEARGLGAGGVTDRIAHASEETARNTKHIIQELQDNGMEFE